MVDVKRCKYIYVLLALLAFAGCAQAQFIGYTSAQSTTSIPFNNSTCTAALAAGTVAITNIGQGAHFLTEFPTGGAPTSLSYTIQGSYDGTTFFDISDVGTYTVNSAGITGVTATGYYPVIGVRVGTCVPGASNVTLKYSGISMTPGQNYGTNQAGQLIKNIATLAAANAGLTSSAFRSPFGSANGTLQFVYTGSAGPAGSTLTVNCGTNGAFVPAATSALPILQTTAGVVQTFQIAAIGCPFFQVAYASGGASTANFNLDYAFANPGLPVAGQQYTHITTTTATAVKATPGYLHTVNINTANAAAGTVSIFDLAAASCTGTPATNTVAVITTPASTNGLPPYIYDLNFLNGICVKASQTMDITISAQ